MASSTDKAKSGEAAEPEVEGNMTEYCKKLEEWLWKAYYQRSLATSAYFTALNTYYGGSGPGGGFSATSANLQANNGNLNNNYINPGGIGGVPVVPPRRNGLGAFWPLQRQPQFRYPAPGGGVVVKIAPIWKRLLAECIDFLILLLVKLFVTFTLIDSFDLIDLDSIDLDAIRNEAGDSAQLQGLYDIAFSLTSELILLELTHRIVVCFFEAYCLWKAGGTPGKTLLGLRVVHADDVLPHVPPRDNNNPMQQQLLWDMTGQTVIVRPGSFLTFSRAFLRSALKNVSLAFFFPLCFTLFHFDYSRTLYDLMAKSVVIEV